MIEVNMLLLRCRRTYLSDPQLPRFALSQSALNLDLLTAFAALAKVQPFAPEVKLKITIIVLNFAVIQASSRAHSRVKMKRKLNDDDVPIGVSPEQSSNMGPTFADLGLEPRLLQAIAKHSFSKPTLVQSKAIPLALEGKDILGELPTCFDVPCPCLT